MRSLQVQDVAPGIESKDQVAEEGKIYNDDSIKKEKRNIKWNILDSKILRCIALLCSMIFISYISLSLLIALILWFFPTIVSAFSNLQKYKSLTKNIMCFNCLGAAPSICFLLKYGDVSAGTISLLVDASTLFYIYAIVAISIVMYFVIPSYIVASENIKLVQKINNVEKELDALSEEWNFKRN